MCTRKPRPRQDHQVPVGSLENQHGTFQRRHFGNFLGQHTFKMYLDWHAGRDSIFFGGSPRPGHVFCPVDQEKASVFGTSILLRSSAWSAVVTIHSIGIRLKGHPIAVNASHVSLQSQLHLGHQDRTVRSNCRSAQSSRGQHSSLFRDCVHQHFLTPAVFGPNKKANPISSAAAVDPTPKQE